MVKVLECDIVMSKLKLESHYCIHFWTNALDEGMNSLILPAIGLIVPLLFFLRHDFGIKLPIKVDMPLNKETNQPT